MAPQTIGLLLGGLVTALLYGVSGIFTKASTEAGIGIGWYLVIVDVTVTVTGIPFLLLRDGFVSMKSGFYAAAMGVTWGIGTGLVALSISRYEVPLGKITPLYNMNTLIAMLLALWIFAEWKEVQVPKLLIGGALIIVGGILVSRS